MLAGDADYIRIEHPGDEGCGAEFLLMRDGTREWHQAKRQRTEGQWTVASLNDAGVLASWWPKIQAGDRCVFVSGTSAQQLDDLTERAAHAESWTEFDKEFLGPENHRVPFDRLREAWGNPPGETVFLALRQVSVHVIDENQLKERVLDRAARLVDGDPAAVARHLGEIVDDSLHHRVTAPDVRRLLAGSGRARIRARTDQDREQHAPGKQQAIHDSTGANVHVEGDRNSVSVHIGPRRPGGHRKRLLIGLTAALAAVATAAYLLSGNYGIPEYFQTGPGAGINVQPSSTTCGNVTPDVLVSPAGNVFTDVSEAHALSLDGRSAFLMRGTFDGAIYYWMISDPNGEYGGMQLIWWVGGGKRHYCSVGLTKAPPAAPAQQGIRQESSMAVPTVVNGESVYFQACIWYRVGKPAKSHCWP